MVGAAGFRSRNAATGLIFSSADWLISSHAQHKEPGRVRPPWLPHSRFLVFLSGSIHRCTVWVSLSVQREEAKVGEYHGDN